MRVLRTSSTHAILAVMLTIYRRHLGKCTKHKRVASCSCPVWVQGILHGAKVRKSLGIRNWEDAQGLVREWESRSLDSVPVSQAFDRYLADCVARGLRLETMRKYQLLGREVVERFGNRPVDAIGIDALSEYRETWKVGPITSRKKVERLRAFFKFCIERKWCQENPALALKHPRSVQIPTLPVLEEDIGKLIEVCGRFPTGGIYGEKTGMRIKAFIMVLRYAGLRIQDCVRLKRSSVKEGKLFLYSSKTSVPVWIPLPDFVLVALAELDGESEYFFWTGGLIKTAVANWQRSLARLGKVAGVSFHAHQLRNSFAVGLLQNGVSLESVSVLLGNSLRVCEKHYSPWIKSRQENLARDIERAWKLTAHRA
jgi:integrase/recombinase XerD